MQALSEADWQAEVIEAARHLGWTHFHVHDSRRSPSGWPDLALVRERLVMVELKRADGKTSVAQDRWLALLAKAGVECYVWRPQDREHMARILSMRKDRKKGET